MSVFTATRLPEELNNRLVVLAKRTDRSRSYYIRKALEIHLGELEDIYLAENTLERVKLSEEPTYSLDDLERELGLER